MRSTVPTSIIKTSFFSARDRHEKNRILSANIIDSRPLCTFSSLRIALRVRIVLVLILILQSACSALTIPEEPPKPTPSAPVWDVQALAEHLRFLNSSEAAGRATGTQGYARVAAYTTARMREFRLQPALADEFRTVFRSSLHFPLDAGLRATGTDSLIFFPGIHFLPDGRSDCGSIQVRNVTLHPEPESVAPRDTVSNENGLALILASEATTSSLIRLRDIGFRGVLVVGRLEPQLAVRPVEGLLVSQVTVQTASLLVGLSVDALSLLLSSREQRRLSLPRVVYQYVATDSRPMAGAINIMGYVAGKHPKYSKQMVIVCSDMDAVGQFVGIRTIDFAHFGIGTAALLEVARNVSHVARYWVIPDRTVMFAIWSGARIGYSGLRSYLEHPTWSLDQTAAIIYVGLAREDIPAVRELLESFDLPLYVVSGPGKPLYEYDTVLMPPTMPRRVTRELNVPRREDPTVHLSDIINQGVQVAQKMADEAHILVLREATVRAE